MFLDTWTYGNAVAPPEYRDRRIGWSDTWMKDGPAATRMPISVSGLHCVIDLNAMELLRSKTVARFLGLASKARR